MHLSPVLLCLAAQVLIIDCFSLQTPSINRLRNVQQVATGNSKSAVRTSSRLFSSTNKQNNPIESLSSECIRAVMASHDVGNSWSQSTLTADLLLVGILQHPERASTMVQRYGIDAETVRQVVQQQLKADVTTDSGKTPLPFGPDVKRLLEKACRIADKQDRQNTVGSEYVLLALLGYNFGRPMTDTCPVGHILDALKLRAFTPFQFCEDLVEDMKTNRQEETTVIKETVVIGQASTGATLASVGVDLTQKALEGELDPVMGRDKEIVSALRTLGRRRKNNPCLIGEPGVGKTAIAEGIAQVLAQSIKDQAKEQQDIQIKFTNPFAGGDDKDEEDEPEDIALVTRLPPCPKSLAGARLISINLASLVAGTANRGDFEKRVQDLIQEASNSNVILFLDEVHQIVGTGGGGDGQNAANLLKPALARGEIRVLGATTTPEYRQYIEKDSALERRFQPLVVKEPSVEETVQILATICSRYEEFHEVEYTNQALYAAAKLSDRYIADRQLPDCAIDMIDEAGSMIRMLDSDEDYFVTEDTIAEVVAQVTNIPVGRLDTGEKERLRLLEKELGARIKGQDVAVQAVSKAIRRSRSGMRDGKRPVSSFMFCGPTGVGKTELCKSLAQAYFGKERDMIRIDMTEYMDRVSVSRLVGAPPGYVGYEEGGQLTEAVRRAPHSLILLDELEKAHEDVLNVLLQVMDDGLLTDGKGRTVSFKNTILVMTSNVGSRQIMELSRNPDTQESMKEAVKGELEAALKPELLNRIDDIVVFEPLGYDNLKDIASNIVDDTIKRTSDDNNIEISVSSSVVEAITREALTVASQFGARPVRRAVRRYVEDTMAEAIMSEFIDEGDNVKLELKQAATADKGAAVNISNGLTGETKEFKVDNESGIGSADSSENLAFVELPDLDSFDDDEDEDDDDDDDDDFSLDRENGAFQ